MWVFGVATLLIKVVLPVVTLTMNCRHHWALWPVFIVLFFEIFFLKKWIYLSKILYIRMYIYRMLINSWPLTKYMRYCWRQNKSKSFQPFFFFFFFFYWTFHIAGNYARTKDSFGSPSCHTEYVTDIERNGASPVHSSEMSIVRQDRRTCVMPLFY